MDVGDRQLMGQIVDVLHALLHLGQLLLKQLRERAIRTGERRVKRTEETRKTNATLSALNREILCGSVCEPGKPLGVLFASACRIV